MTFYRATWLRSYTLTIKIKLLCVNFVIFFFCFLIDLYANLYLYLKKTRRLSMNGSLFLNKLVRSLIFISKCFFG